MAEGKLTLPVIHALNATGNEEMIALARKVKEGSVDSDEIARLVEFTKNNGGIEYAEERMEYFRQLCIDFIDKSVVKPDVKEALLAYVDFVIQRKK